jgi:uncharacterized damage-inducible protein DinB
MVDALRTLYRHMYWADQRVLEALRAATVQSARALEIYAHVLGAEHVWLSRIRQKAPEYAVWPRLTVEECADLGARLHEEFQKLIDGLDENTVHQNVHYRNSAGDEFDTSLADILLHVALHGTYHRGQVALLMRDAGAEPAPTDYIALVRGAPAATRRA